MSKKNRRILADLAMDLKRVALGYQRGSNIMAERFFEEALKRKKEIDVKNLKPYLNKSLDKIVNLNKEKKDKAIEDALMYSTVFQNASQTG